MISQRTTKRQILERLSRSKEVERSLEIARLRTLNAELVEALEETYDWINPDTTDAFREMASRVHAALAKAKGGA